MPLQISSGIQIGAGISIELDQPLNQQAVFAFGWNGTDFLNISNYVSTTGTVASDTVIAADAKGSMAGAGYGGDKGIFAYGQNSSISVNTTNLVTNTGIIGSDTAGAGQVRIGVGAAGYGYDKAIFGFGSTGPVESIVFYNTVNLVTNTGTVSNNVTNAATARGFTAAATYDQNKAIFAFGSNPYLTQLSVSNLVTDLGVISTDTATVGTARAYVAAASYGIDKAIFGFGSILPNYPGETFYSITNLVNNLGVLASDVVNAATPRTFLAASKFGTDQAIFGFGYNGSNSNVTNIVNNLGIVASDVISVGTGRRRVAAVAFGG